MLKRNHSSVFPKLSTSAKLSFLFVCFFLIYCQSNSEQETAVLPSVEMEEGVEIEFFRQFVSLPDSIPTADNFCSGDISPKGSIDLTLINYIAKGADAEGLEAYWQDWSWMNSNVEADNDQILLFDFGEEGKLLPFLMEDGFFPGVVSGRYGVWSGSDWLCMGTLAFYDTANMDIPTTLNTDKARRIYLKEQFIDQFWLAVQDSLNIELGFYKPQ